MIALKKQPRTLAYSFESAVLIHENRVFHQIDLWDAFLINVNKSWFILAPKILIYNAYWTKFYSAISNSAKVNYILQLKIWQHLIVSGDSNSAKPANSNRKFWNNYLTVLSQRPQLRYANLETSHRRTQHGGACRRHLILRFLSAGNFLPLWNL